MGRLKIFVIFVLIWIVLIVLASGICAATWCDSYDDCDIANNEICNVGLNLCMNLDDGNVPGEIEIVNISPSVCNGQLVDITVKGVYPVKYSWAVEHLGTWFGGFYDWSVGCFTNYQLSNYELYSLGETYDIQIVILENDAPDIYPYESTDDMISQVLIKATTAIGIGDNSYGSCIAVPYEYTFKNVNLGQLAGESFEGSNVELIAFAIGDPQEQLIHDIDITADPGNDAWKSDEYNVNVITGQCGSGECCDMSTCNYKSSSKICNEKESTSYACQWGTTAGSDVGIKYANRYCSGTSSSCNGNLIWTSTSVYEDCDMNEACKAGYTVCQQVYCKANLDCGTDGYSGSRYCSGNNVYQNYKIWRCNNAGTSSAYCSYTKTGQLIETCENSCINGECCVAHSSTACYDNDVYYYNSCDYIEDKKEECTNGCSNGACVVCNSHASYKCADNNDVYWYNSCNAKEEIKEDCAIGCLNGACILPIACSKNSDCGTDGWVGTNSCYNGNIWNTYKIWNCLNPGTANAVCTSSNNYVYKEGCADGCLNGACVTCTSHSTYSCYDNDVYYYNSCNVLEDKKTECANGCLNGACIIPKIQCSVDSDCGATGGWIGPKVCSDKKILDMWMSRKCINPGTVDSYCSETQNQQERYDCRYDCKIPECGECNLNSTYKCYDNDVYWYDVCGGLGSKKEECANGCTNNACIILCDSHSYSECYDGDVYYYNSCNILEDKKEDCGTNGYVGNNYCYDNDVYKDYIVLAECSGNACNKVTQKMKQSECPNGCSNGTCIIECSQNSDCGIDSWAGQIVCFQEFSILYDVWTEHICENPGTTNSRCITNGAYQPKEECADGCLNNACRVCTSHSTYFCYDNDVYWYNSCSRKEDKKTECGASGYSGANYCYDNDVYINYITNGCSGNGCTSSTQKIKQTECPNGCNNGVCVGCSSHSTYSCYDNDIYYYNSCNVKEDKKTECGTSGYSGSNYCYDNDVYIDYSAIGCSGNSCSNTTGRIKQVECGALGCSAGSAYCCMSHNTFNCYDNDVYWYDSCGKPQDKKEECVNGCLYGKCITCNSHSTYLCYDNDVYYYDSCSVKEDKKTECGTSGYVGTNYCYDNDVYKDYTTTGCSGNSCSNTTGRIKQTECPNGCSNGACVIACSQNSDCGTDSWIGGEGDVCNNGDIWHEYLKRICINPGTAYSECDYTIESRKRIDCEYSCSNGQCTYPGKADFAWFNPSNGEWTRYILNENTKIYEKVVPSPVFGASTDVPVPADYDGDNVAEIGIFRKSDGKIVWAEAGGIYKSAASHPKGKQAVADYDGDKKADYAWFIPETRTWKIYESSKNYAERKPNIVFGLGEDKPISADFNGDGKAEIATFRKSDGKIRWVDTATSKIMTINAGNSAWLPAAADYDGDKKADFAWFNPLTGEWIIYKSSAGYAAPYYNPRWGGLGDVPTPADYDGDGKADIAVFRSDGKIAVYLAQSNQMIVSQDGNSAWKPVIGDYNGGIY